MAIVTAWVAKLKLCCAGRSASKLHQEELMQKYLYPEFNLAVRFSLAINCVWCTLTYSAGMPALNLVALMYFVFAYFSDKYVLLRASRKPPQYDTAPAMAAFWACLYATLVHLGIAIWIFGNPTTFPSSWALMDNLTSGINL